MAGRSNKRTGNAANSPQISLTAAGELALALVPHFARDANGEWDGKELAFWITSRVEGGQLETSATEARRVFWLRDRWVMARPFRVFGSVVTTAFESGRDGITSAGPRPPLLDQFSSPVIRRINERGKSSSLEAADDRQISYMYRWIWVARVSDQIAPRPGDPTWDLFAGPLGPARNYDERALYLSQTSSPGSPGVQLANTAELSKELGVSLPISFY